MMLHTQNVVTRLWTTLSRSDHAELRHVLMQYLITSHTVIPAFIRNKQIKLIVLMGRADWPHEYPEFFSDILQVCVCESGGGWG